MIRLLLLASTLVAPGCLPPLDLPECSSDQDCLNASEPGFCSCLDGYCYKFACSIGTGDTSVAVDTVDAGSPDTTAPVDPCPATPGTLTTDGCCSPALSDRSSDPDCVLFGTDLELDDAYLALLAPSGHLVLLSGPSDSRTLSIVEPTTGAQRHIPVGAALGALALSADQIAVADDGAFSAYDLASPHASSVIAYAPLASVPIPVGDGTYLAVAPDGAVRRLGGTDPAIPAITPTSSSYTVALSADAATLFVIGASRLTVAPLSPSSTRHTVDSVQGEPAVVDSATVAFASTGSALGAVRRYGATWTTLPPVEVASALTSPVVSADGLILVASTVNKGLTAVRIQGSTLLPVWTATALDAPASAAPLILSDGAIAVPLADGQLVVLETPAPGAVAPPVRWKVRPATTPVAHPRQADDHSVLYVSSDGVVRRFWAAVGNQAHPWPTLRGDRAGTGKATP